MKNRIPASITLAVLLLLCMLGFRITATAQGFDVFGGTRTLVVATPQVLLVTANNTLTNSPVDIHHFVGIAKMDLFWQTNSAGTMTVNVQTSADQTNWTALGSYALATYTSITNLTNPGVNVAPNITNTYLLPGTITTPVVGTAGFYSPYLSAAAFTNSGAITMSGSNVVSIGFNTDDANRYIRTIWTPAGTVTNGALGAILTGKCAPTPLIP